MHAWSQIRMNLDSNQSSEASTDTSLLRRILSTSSRAALLMSPMLEGRKNSRKKFVERGILIVIILVVIIAIFAPIGVLIEEFLNIEKGAGGPFNYEESCITDSEPLTVVSN